MFFVSKKKYNKLVKENQELTNFKKRLVDTMLTSKGGYVIIEGKYGDVNSEIGITVNSGHPYYAEIKELAIKGVR